MAGPWIIITRRYDEIFRKRTLPELNFFQRDEASLSLSLSLGNRAPNPGETDPRKKTIRNSNGKRQFMAPSFWVPQGERGKDAPSRLGPFAYPERKHFLPRRNRLSLSPYRRSSLPTAMSPKVTCVGKKMVGDLFWVCRKTIRISNTPPTHTLQGVAKTQQKKTMAQLCFFLFPGNKWPPPL
jgi:hypothetical protein